jgi:hypothetical protein
MMFESVVIGITISIVLILYAFNINWLQFANIHTKGAVTATGAQAPEGKSGYSIDKLKSGLDVFDSLNNGKLSRISVDQAEMPKQNKPSGWYFYGSAFGVKAPVTSYERRDGLLLGLKAANEGQWVSYYAMSPETNATVFHAIITTPYKLINDGTLQTGLYIQTSTRYGHVNYVSCGSDVSASGIFWGAVETLGNYSQATRYTTLWADKSSNQPLTRDCKIVTNGNNLLEIYMDNNLVYSNDKLKLQMPVPFNSYLELTTPSSDTIRYGLFNNYYSAYGEDLKVINGPIGGYVKIIGKSNELLASAVYNDGVADLNIIKHSFPLNGMIRVYDSTNKIIASTPNTVSIFGGDVYALIPSSPSPSSSYAAAQNNVSRTTQ